jgi:hypothetical protein
MSNTTKTCWTETVLKINAEAPVVTEAEEQEIARIMGQEYVEKVKQLDLLDVALGDLEAIKEARPDLPDRDVAHLVRTADDDEDAEAWVHRVLNFRSRDETV